ncbi:Alcohol dehydrogenase superfamily, zinc-type [Metarhizium robertsii ARSEF 23]|uniref:Alcohol dehydrogenase superfamily, zinc-type n=1 Tax=Metarhizium robertsii (strain ARSEF 23 / ATCC MYA-3075) TaxID=655844 RepID=A0A0B2XGU9_METRA|nr:Alcohol dehydrogenase superfamily, zinc-type [Metarhizium robertsii ARSEF 23]KHO10782.1 Alcohol dehydrogenase superfamily, zinc-type [Metarhizium robertsii ARSEF 23]
MSYYKFNEDFVESGDLITAYVWCMRDGTIGKATLFNEAKNIYDSGELGIGGGASSENHDIRLGDVVVSTPCGKEGGVIQYDFGKAVQNRSFQYTKLLDQPPTALRTALNGIKAQYKRKGHRLQEEIEIALCNNPRLRKSCTTLCSDDPDNLVSRPMREQDEDNIVEAHRWTVGSVLGTLLDCRSNTTQARVTAAWSVRTSAA